MANGLVGMRFVQLNNDYYYKETPFYKRRLQLYASGYLRPFQQRTEICASSPFPCIYPHVNTLCQKIIILYFGWRMDVYKYNLCKQQSVSTCRGDWGQSAYGALPPTGHVRHLALTSLQLFFRKYDTVAHLSMHYRRKYEACKSKT